MAYADGKTASMSYNAAGQLVSQTDPDGVTTLYIYNAKGEQETTCIDVDQNGQIDFSGADRITQSLRSVVSDHGTTVQRTVTQVYAGDNNAAPTVTSVVDQSVDGLNTWQTQFGQTTYTQTVYGAPGAKTVTTINPDGTKKVQAYGGGRLVYDACIDSTGATVASTSYAYDDPFGRLSSKTDARTGTTSYTYDAKDRVLTTTAPAINGSGSPLVTTNGYDDINRITTVTLPDGSTTTKASYPNGQLKSTSGSQTYPVEYTYDAQGRMKTMTTHGAAGDETTTWNYDPQRGTLTSKVYPDGNGTGYTYTAAGRLLTRTWARQINEQPLVTTYGYNTAGDLTSTVYSDNTPAVAITYNRLGQKLSAGNSASATVYGYDSATLRLLTETVTGPVNRTLKRGYDALGRPAGIAVMSGTDVEQQVGYGYDAAGRLATVSAGTDAPSASNTFAYGYVPGSRGLIASLTGPALTGTQPVVAVANTWELTRDVLAAKENRDANGNVVSRYDYVVNNLGQRVSVQHSGSAFAGNAFNLYGYDGMGQLTSANRFNGNDRGNTQNPITGQQFGFAFDNIGNRLTATDGLANTSYTPNTLNQYSAIQSGTVAAVAPTYDADGNTLSDGTLVNQWDGENRLVTVTKPDGTQIACAYDAQSRRVRKTVTASGGVVLSDTAYLYDVWNLVAEYDLAPANATAPALLATNTWGIDLSGSPQGAGGVGGLLSRNTNGTTYAYTFDGNGNVSETLDTAGMAAHYEYGPFGEAVRVSGAMAGQNPFRFSTKYTDDETGLLYYGYRYYNPTTGRWINRDPSGERGGKNNYCICNNNALSQFDYLGLKSEGADLCILRQAATSWRAAGEKFAANLLTVFYTKAGSYTPSSDDINLIKNSSEYRSAAQSYFEGLFNRQSGGGGAMNISDGNPNGGPYAFEVRYWSGELFDALGGAHFYYSGTMILNPSSGTWRVNVSMSQNDFYSFSPTGFLGWRLADSVYRAANELETKYGYPPFWHTETWSDAFQSSN